MWQRKQKSLVAASALFSSSQRFAHSQKRLPNPSLVCIKFEFGLLCCALIAIETRFALHVRFADIFIVALLFWWVCVALRLLSRLALLSLQCAVCSLCKHSKQTGAENRANFDNCFALRSLQVWWPSCKLCCATKTTTTIWTRNERSRQKRAEYVFYARANCFAANFASASQEQNASWITSANSS